MSPAGSFLENYKQLYVSQPKIVRIVVLPTFIAVLGAALQILPNLSDTIKIAGGVFLFFLLGLGSYHQLIEVDLHKELEDEINALKDSLMRTEESEAFWAKRVEDFAQLDNIFSELVLYKSKMWLETLHVAHSVSCSAAKDFIRSKNSLQENIDRIVAALYRFLDRYSVAAEGLHFRVAYFTPSPDQSRLQLTSWAAFQQIIPKISRSNLHAFEKGGASLASYVWTRDDSQFAFIHNINEYLDQNRASSIFSRMSGDRKSVV